MDRIREIKGFDEDFLWLFHKVEYAAICLSLDYNIIDLTPAAEILFSVLRKKILNEPISSLFEQIGLKIILPKDKQDRKDRVIQISENGTPLKFKSKNTQKILNLNWQLKQKNTPNGELAGFIVYTEEQKTEKEDTDKSSKLFMQRLAAGIAHEIRTPLAIININTDLLKKTLSFTEKNKEDEVKKKYIDTIKYAIRLASRIIDNILTMIRTLSSGEIIPNNFHHASISESVTGVLEIYPFLESEKTLVSFDKSKDFIYYGDKMLTEHMLFNLIKNALSSIKAANKGKIKIRLESGKLDNKLIFTDTALGISENELPYVFDQFAAKKAGSGLGLVFCKTVMQSYGGGISCASLLGKYTEFTLSFPSKLSLAKNTESGLNLS